MHTDDSVFKRIAAGSPECVWKKHKHFGLGMNFNKTQFIRAGWDIEINGNKIHSINAFKYPGKM